MEVSELIEFAETDPRAVRSDGSFNNNLARKKYTDKVGGDLKLFHDTVMSLTSWADHLHPTFAIRIKLIKEGITSQPSCYCGTPLKFNWDYKQPETFNSYCSAKCARNCENVKAKQVTTCLERYGVTNPSLHKETVDKIKEKISTLTFDIVVSRAKVHYQDRFTYKDLGKGTVPKWIEVYCIEHDHAFTPNIKDLMSGKTNCPKCRSQSLSKRYMLSKEQVVENLYMVKGDQITLTGEYTGMHCSTEFSCKEHGPFITKPYQMFQDQNCPRCHAGVSKQEGEVVAFVESIRGHAPLSNCRRTLGNGKEIDVICEDERVMFEYNGLYWHSYEKMTDKYYHLRKTEHAEAAGFQLFHIWSHEWGDKTKQEIWKSIITNALGKSEKIYARKCSIVELGPKEYSDFMFLNHLQGCGSMAKHRYGLVYNDELVSVMSFSKPRFTKDFDFELVRFANKTGTSVVGGASKLFNYFVKGTGNGCSIISYADRRLSRGKLYENLGFKFSHHSEPGYFYTKDFVKTLSRYQCQKHKLADLLVEFDPSLSEYENMLANQYYMIHDCGNSVWHWKP